MSVSSDHRQSFGRDAEQAVAKWLTTQGYSIVTTNYRQRFGEIDIIANRADVLAFVEVKVRANDYFNLSEVITYSKQQKIIKTAQYYCMQNEVYDTIIRFDVALLTRKTSSFALQYIPNAFTKSEF